MIKILVIFTCFNRKEKTTRCIESLVKQNQGIMFDFIAVDDNSSDGTAEYLKMYSNVEVLNGTGQLYYSGGMHLGMEYAKQKSDIMQFDYCLLLNDDVDFFESAIVKMVSCIKGSADYILAGATCDNFGNLSYGGVIKKRGYKPAFEIVMGNKGMRRCDTFNANCVLIPIQIFLENPSIDSHYSHSLGDFDYGLRLFNAGIQIMVTDFFVGECNDNLPEGTWLDRGLSRKRRIHLKESPKGLPRKEWFYFLHVHFGLLKAVVFSITPYVKIMLRR